MNQNDAANLARILSDYKRDLSYAMQDLARVSSGHRGPGYQRVDGSWSDLRGKTADSIRSEIATLNVMIARAEKR